MKKKDKRKALGKGINALIPDFEKGEGETQKKDGLIFIPLEEIVPGQNQPRKHFDDEKLAELVESIKENGVVQPVVVQKSKDNYELICGERRWRACQKAGLKRIPALVRDVNNTESLQIALIENIHRQDLNPIEEAEAYHRLMGEYGLTQEQVSKRVGKNRATVANYLRLLKLSRPIKDDLVTGRLTMGHARALLGLDTDRQREEARRDIIRKNLNVRQLEHLVQRTNQPGKPARPIKKAQKDIFIKDLERTLEKSLGTKVSVEPKKKGGQVVIQYYSNDDLQRIHDILVK